METRAEERAGKSRGIQIGKLAFGVGAVLAARAVIRRARRFDFTGRVALITGGSRGLGLLIARELAAEGARVALCARDPEELERAQRIVRDSGAEVMTFPCDVTDRTQVEEMVERVGERFGQIDVLVNNAGIIQVGPMEEMTLEDYEEAMRLHFWAPLYAIQAIAPGMQARRSGRIVNISSIGGALGVPHLLPYSASKFALTGLSEGLRAELAKDGVLVTTVCPGLMRTGSVEQAYFKGQHRAEYTLFTLMASLPVSSMDAGSAARQIVQACRFGEPYRVLSLPAQGAALLHGVFPGLLADLFGLVNRALPGPGGIGARRVRGADSHTRLAPSWVTRLTGRAVVSNNEAVSLQDR